MNITNKKFTLKLFKIDNGNINFFKDKITHFNINNKCIHIVFSNNTLIKYYVEENELSHINFSTKKHALDKADIRSIYFDRNCYHGFICLANQEYIYINFEKNVVKKLLKLKKYNINCVCFNSITDINNTNPFFIGTKNGEIIKMNISNKAKHKDYELIFLDKNISIIDINLINIKVNNQNINVIYFSTINSLHELEYKIETDNSLSSLENISSKDEIFDDNLCIKTKVYECCVESLYSIIKIENIRNINYLFWLNGCSIFISKINNYKTKKKNVKYKSKEYNSFYSSSSSSSYSSSSSNLFSADDNFYSDETDILFTDNEIKEYIGNSIDKNYNENINENKINIDSSISINKKEKKKKNFIKDYKDDMELKNEKNVKRNNIFINKRFYLNPNYIIINFLDLHIFTNENINNTILTKWFYESMKKNNDIMELDMNNDNNNFNYNEIDSYENNEKNEYEKKTSIIDMCITDLYILLLLEETLLIINNIDYKIVFKQNLSIETYGPLIKLMKDYFDNEIWLCTSKYIYKIIVNNNNNDDIFSLNLKKNSYKKLTNTDKIVKENIIKKHLIENNKYTIEKYKYTNIKKEDILLSFLHKKQYFILSYYLYNNISFFNNIIKIALFIWLIELNTYSLDIYYYLYKIVSYKDFSIFKKKKKKNIYINKYKLTNNVNSTTIDNNEKYENDILKEKNHLNELNENIINENKIKKIDINLFLENNMFLFFDQLINEEEKKENKKKCDFLKENKINIKILTDSDNFTILLKLYKMKNTEVFHFLKMQKYSIINDIEKYKQELEKERKLYTNNENKNENISRNIYKHIYTYKCLEISIYIIILIKHFKKFFQLNDLIIHIFQLYNKYNFLLLYKYIYNDYNYIINYYISNNKYNLLLNSIILFPQNVISQIIKKYTFILFLHKPKEYVNVLILYNNLIDDYSNIIISMFIIIFLWYNNINKIENDKLLKYNKLYELNENENKKKNENENENKNKNENKNENENENEKKHIISCINFLEYEANKLIEENITDIKKNYTYTFECTWKNNYVINCLLILYIVNENDEKIKNFLDKLKLNNIHFDYLFIIRFLKEKKKDKFIPHIYILMKYYEEAIDKSLELNDFNTAKEVVSLCEDEEEKKKLFLKIIKYISKNLNHKNMQDIINFVRDFNSIVNLHDILPYINENNISEFFKKNIYSLLETYNLKIKAKNEEIYQNLSTIHSLNNDIQNMKKKHVILNKYDICFICKKTIFYKKFYVFSCNHYFHSVCALSVYLNAKNKETLFHFYSILQNYKNAIINNNENDILLYETKIDEILTEECFICGHLSINFVFQNFISNENDIDNTWYIPND